MEECHGELYLLERCGTLRLGGARRGGGACLVGETPRWYACPPREEGGEADPKYRDPWVELSEPGCNKNQLRYPYRDVTCYHGRCCYPGPGEFYGCNPDVSPNPVCCTGVCDPATNQCTPIEQPNSEAARHGSPRTRDDSRVLGDPTL